jgi:uncharacterized protein YyaL (SSP411 family)
MSNELIQATSPYLLQHKNNPVEWVQWSAGAFEKAEKENKLVIVSIGYSACHWCHVMEHECFENEEVAALMNQHFVCIKVDREERPDVDKVYMEALQLMSQQGGWPLNCFTLPNKQPFFGGTYFPKERWMSVMNQIIKLKENDYDKLVDFATKLTRGIEENLNFYSPEETDQIFTIEDLMGAYKKWSRNFDAELGGNKGAPKFPLPASIISILEMGILTEDTSLLNHVELTLNEMARGGIYDQIGGGFTRYSVDDYWKVPHFEKMLYDNAQLIELYAKGYGYFGHLEYKNCVAECVAFVERELKDSKGLFYCALDADSEGVEGKFYIWHWDELVELLKDDFEFAKFYYNFNAFGSWEEHYIPLRQMSDEAIATHFEMKLEDVQEAVLRIKKTLFELRTKRIRPTTDTKVLCSWNALMVKGLLAAAKHIDEELYLPKARILMKSMQHHFIDNESGKLIRTVNNLGPIEGFLDDYAQYIDACIIFFEFTSETHYLEEAMQLTYRVLDQFYDLKRGLFLFSPISQQENFALQTDCIDDVIPSSNSVMADCLKKLSEYKGYSHAEDVYSRLTKNLYKQTLDSPYNFSNWLRLFQGEVSSHRTFVITGSEALNWKKALSKHKNWSDILLVSTKDSELPIFKGRFSSQLTRTFVCENKTCGLPLDNLEAVISTIHGIKKPF